MVIKSLLISVALLLVTGCSSMVDTAAYTYSHIDKNGASCAITINSLRELQGVSVTISNNCELTAAVEQASTSEAMAQAVLGLVNKIPDVPSVFPIPPVGP